MNRYQFIWGSVWKTSCYKTQRVLRTHVRKGVVVIERQAIK